MTCGVLVLAGLTGCRSTPPATLARSVAVAPSPVAVPSGVPAPAVRVPRPDGTLHLVPVRSAVLGTGGPLLTFSVQVEGGLGVAPLGFARAVEQTLGDPRSWGADGRRRFQRVDSGTPDFRVSLASPGLTDRLCAPMQTHGRLSCAPGNRAVVNVDRWLTAVPGYPLATYRQYVVDHEVGHVLGHGHAACPGPGELAPVMLQQTLGLDGCRRSPWPFP